MLYHSDSSVMPPIGCRLRNLTYKLQTTFWSFEEKQHFKGEVLGRNAYLLCSNGVGNYRVTHDTILAQYVAHDNDGITISQYSKSA